MQVTFLTIKIISGHNLPRHNNKQTDDTIQPFVKIKVHGHPCDEEKWNSKVDTENGCNPVWDETKKFDLAYPELVLLEFKVVCPFNNIYDFSVFLFHCVYRLKINLELVAQMRPLDLILYQ